MSGFVRTKRATDPLDDQARARLVGGGTLLSYVSSGSEYSAADDDSPCLSELVQDFFEGDPEEERSPGYDSDSDRDDSISDCVDSVEDLLRSAAGNDFDPYRNLLSSQVAKAVEVFSSLREQSGVFRRKVMAVLRELGHNAAICKTKWGSSGGLTAGSYEFIDVVQPISSTLRNRYVVDLDFAAQFEIARPTAAYTRLSQSLPRVFVGRIEDVKRIVKAMCDAARRSLKSRKLSLAPWRKNRYMQNKWFGPYRRTVNPCSSNSLKPVVSPVSGVNCRYVGFDDAVNSRLFIRTR